MLTATRQEYIVKDEYAPTRPFVEFRLIYHGRLPSATSSSIEDTNRIRRQFHEQLKDLWHVDPNLPNEAIPAIGRNYNRAGLDIVPLVTERNSWVCAVDILFLRRDPPGKIIMSGGDLDNRIKVLFDGMRMPKDAQEIGDDFKDLGAPLFCLLEDDALIVEAKVTTDRLLTPVDVTHNENKNHVHLIVHVRTDIVDLGKAFAAGLEK